MKAFGLLRTTCCSNPTFHRKLASVSNGKSIQYSYDHTGARVKKAVAGTTTEYRMAGSLIVTEKTGNDIIWYHYDSAGNLFAVNIGGTRYYYLKNIQNDVIGLIDGSGNQVVEYKYDSQSVFENSFP